MKKILFIALLSAITANIQVYFSPDDSCEKVIIQTIESADSTIDAALYIFTEGASTGR